MTVEAPSADTLSGPAPTVRSRTEPGLFAGRLALGIIALGLLVIGFGWYGISGSGALIDGSTDVRAQLPYLISGGFLGLALVVVGSALLVAQTTRLERARSEAHLEARIDALTAALGGHQLPVAGADEVVAGASAYHRPGCRLVDGRDGQEYVTVEVAVERGLRPCRLCVG